MAPLATPVRHVKLIGLDWGRPKDPPLSLGAASMSAQLKARQLPHQLRSFGVNSPAFSADAVVQWALEGSGPDTCLCFGAYVWAEPQLQWVLHELRANGFHGVVALGGPQVTYTSPSSAQKLEQLYPQADVFVRGYGEPGTLLLAMQARLDDPAAASARQQAGVHLAGSPDVGFVAQVDLQDLESPLLSGLLPPQPFMRWELQRGCPYKCAFCQHREGEGSFNRNRRSFEQTRVLQEAAWICRHPIIQDVAVVDPTFNAGPHYLRVLEALAQGAYSGKLSLQCRFELVTEHFIQAVSAHPARITLEFGLQTIHPLEAALISRPNCMPVVEAAMASLRQAGIHFEVSLIYGLPGQTLASFAESLAFCRRMGVPVVRSWPLLLLRGTPLADRKHGLGLVESHDLGVDISDKVGSAIPHVVASPTFSFHDWLAMWELAQGGEG